MVLFNIVIPTKGRIEMLLDKTLNMLEKFKMLNNPNTPIYLFVDPEDYDEYDDIYGGEMRVIFGNCGLVEQRRAIRQYFEEDDKLLILDDDVDDVVGLEKNKTLIDTICYCFNQMIENDTYLGSINPTSNKHFFSGDELFGLYFCYGCFYFEINKKEIWSLYLDTALSDELEDYHRTILFYKLYGKVYRYDKIGIKHKYNKNKGGMNSINRDKNHIKKLEYLKEKYPNLVMEKKKARGKSISLQNNKNIFKTIYVSRVKNIGLGVKCDIDDDSIILNIKIIDKETNEVIGVVLHDVLPDLDNFYGINYYFNQVRKSTTRGAIAGVIEKHLQPGFIQDKFYKYIRTKPYSIKNINSNYEVNNLYDSVSLGYIRHLNQLKLSVSTVENTDPNDILKEYLDVMERYFKMYTPHVDNKNFRYLDTVFSSIIINRSEIAKSHFDSLNRGWACLSHIKNAERYKHDFDGAYLMLCDYNLVINYGTKSLVLFDSINIKHANTPFIIDGVKYWNYNNTNRLSMVSYVNKFVK